MLLVSMSILIWFLVDLWGGLDARALLTRIPAVLLCAGTLLSVLLYGKSQIVHPPGLEASTSIGALLSRVVPFRREPVGFRKAG